MAKFSVVEFPEENPPTVEVVCTEWLKDNKTTCFWPNVVGSNSYRSLVVNCATPKSHPKIVWSLFPVRFFGAYRKFIFKYNNPL